MAIDMGYTELAKKSESYEICFVPDNDYRGFLKNKVEGLEERVNGGNFVRKDGTILGKHRGYPFYTIGQRKGLELAVGEPMFVVEIQPDTNTIVLGTQEELERNGMWVRNINLQKYAAIDTEMDSISKIRYKDAGTPSIITQHDNKMITSTEIRDHVLKVSGTFVICQIKSKQQ